MEQSAAVGKRRDGMIRTHPFRVPLYTDDRQGIVEQAFHHTVFRILDIRDISSGST